MNAKSSIGRFIMGAGREQIKFYAPSYLKAELSKHFDKLVERSKFSPEEVRKQVELVYSRITFISDDQIPISYYVKAATYVREVDIDDIVFIALNDYFNETLWTGDTKLYRHLIKKGYERVINFEELKEKYRRT